jgi:hypothetical protein
MKVALCFWGICRSTNFTIDSIKSCIFDPLHTAGIEYDTFVHTYCVKSLYSNIRAKESNINLNNDLWKLLNPRSFVIENQDEIKDKLNVKSYRTKGNPWNDDKNTYTTLDNHILALWSLKQVTQIWKPNQTQYSHIVYLRPDVRFLNPIQSAWFTSSNDSKIKMPNFHLMNGCNDRFAIGNPRIMSVYGNRFDDAYKYSLTNKLHSESFLAYTLLKHRIQIEHIPIYFIRIRADGQECPGDKNLTRRI